MPKRLYQIPDDFEAEIRIFTEAQGGRSTPPFNGVRWDFAYEEDDLSKDGIFMIWPDFYDIDRNSLPRDQSLPVDQILTARMTVVVDEMREKVHRRRIIIGTRFYCHEGNKRVAEGIVVQITGLHLARDSSS